MIRKLKLLLQRLLLDQKRRDDLALLDQMRQITLRGMGALFVLDPQWEFSLHAIPDCYPHSPLIQALQEERRRAEQFKAENLHYLEMMAWLQSRAEEGCVTMCFELEGGVHVTLDPCGGEQSSAREVNDVREGIERLMREPR